MSYTSQQFLIFDNSSDANYRSWGSAISAALDSMGVSKTSDTGQVNWTTVTSPASGSFNYEIRKFTDALQTGSTQIFFKFEYGSSSGSPKGPRLRISVGTSTDGAGNLTGMTMGNFEPGSTSGVGQGSVTYECNFSGDTDRFCIMLWRNLNAQGAPIILCTERTKNTDGTNSSDGVTVIQFGNSGSPTGGGQQTMVFGGAGAANATAGRSYLGLYNGTGASDAFNNNVPVSPIWPDYGKYGNPMTVIAFVHSQDVAEGCEFTVTLYGATRTYLRTGNISQVVPSSNMVPCMRYD